MARCTILVSSACSLLGQTIPITTNNTLQQPASCSYGDNHILYSIVLAHSALLWTQKKII